MHALSSQPAVRTASAAPSPAGDGVARVNVLGVGVSALNLPTAVRSILTAARSGRKGYVCVCGAHGVIECQDDPALRDIHNAAFLVTPDGMPLVWALHHAGHAAAGRVYGPDLMRAVITAGQSGKIRHFLYGATEATLERLVAGLAAFAPDAIIAGRYAPPFRPLTADEEAEIAARIDAARADIVWVGLSTPKQERWMAKMRPHLAAPLLIGVGAAFDFHAGNKVQAPRWMQSSGLEWAFRMASEPRRLARRYAHVVPRYIYLSTLQRLGARDHPLEG
ncbi:WecB/TagA/CpsF family glycosyltransferase [Acuticoccus kandeliae]|uniref:WecB/TagA/CpsF family glycosyltransferase n=1 Tax=Acuticoccus kandeliae TaxID=2073160 RepID=UPI000D3EAEE6|nr:WecB/TagA/CpsF family glycosyltransferase [Acuticoccus kandeliae]